MRPNVHFRFLRGLKNAQVAVVYGPKTAWFQEYGGDVDHTQVSIAPMSHTGASVLHELNVFYLCRFAITVYPGGHTWAECHYCSLQG